MARAAKTPTKKSTVKSKKRSAASLPGSVPKVWLFAVLFAVVGVVALLRIGAKPDLPTYSDDIVAAYTKVSPTSITRDENGNVAYEMYPASYYVLADGTLVCDDGATSGETVRTDTLSRAEVARLHGDIKKLGLESLPNEVSGSSDATAVVEFEGFLLGRSANAKGVAVHAGAKKPDQFAKAQERLLALCGKATQSEKRQNTKKPKEPKLSSTDQGLLHTVASRVVPKAEACCNTGTEDKNYANDQMYRINAHRAGHGIRSLSRQACLDTTALNWTHKMTNQGYIQHNPNLGNDVTNNCRVYWTKLGENVGVGYDSAGLFQAFLNSSSHHRNVEDKAWLYAGVAAVRHPDGRTFVTQNYGRW